MLSHPSRPGRLLPSCPVMPELVTLNEAVETYSVSKSSLFRWLRQGALIRYRRKGQKAILIDARELRRILKPQPEKR